MTLNPARLARFTDWASTLPPRPLPRPVIPVPGEYYLDYVVERQLGAGGAGLPVVRGPAGPVMKTEPSGRPTQP